MLEKGNKFLKKTAQNYIVNDINAGGAMHEQTEFVSQQNDYQKISVTVQYESNSYNFPIFNCSYTQKITAQVFEDLPFHEFSRIHVLTT